MSHESIDIDAGSLTLSYDFTIQDSYKAANNGQYEESNGKFSLYPGDLDQNGIIEMTDFTGYLQPNYNTSFNYQNLGDYNMDTEITALDASAMFGFIGASVTTDVEGH
jgi:hypothetical protein